MQVRTIGRREFVTVFGAAAAWAFAGHAQQGERIRRAGVLIGFSENDPFARAIVPAFTQAMRRLGWVEGKNIRLDYRFAAGDPVLFEKYAVELVALSPDTILAGTPPAVSALRQQTSTIPIVFVLVVDPVGQGFVQSLAQPGGSITGFGAVDPPIIGKWIQLLKEIAPRVTRIAIIFNPDTAPYAPMFNRVLEAAAASFGINVTLAPVRSDAAIEEAVAAQAREPGGGILCLPDSFSVTHADAISAAATRHKLPLNRPTPFWSERVA